ncbi:MAG: exosortase-associated EpsI family protein [Verrucomicrobia bacterium]|nr:exosortase-associated EpsI family protein [Verrucomicrobiota bacterium]
MNPAKPMPFTAAPATAPRGRRWVFAILGVVLAAVLLVEILPALVSKPPAVQHVPLAEALPQAVPGWTAKVVPVANTPEMRQAVSGILQFDEAEVVQYTSADGIVVEVYAAYWKAGKAPYSLVGAHNPDTCWINNGWDCVSRTHAFVREVDGRTLKPGEEGGYTPRQGGGQTDVLFWHLVGGRPHDGYGLEGWADGFKGHLQRLPLVFRDLKRYSFNLAQEQMFVRISTQARFADLFGREDFRRLMLALEPVGLLEPKA